MSVCQCHSHQHVTVCIHMGINIRNCIIVYNDSSNKSISCGNYAISEGKYQSLNNNFPTYSILTFDVSNIVTCDRCVLPAHCLPVFQFKHAVYVHTCKLFADLERLRQESEMKDMHNR